MKKIIIVSIFFLGCLHIFAHIINSKNDKIKSNPQIPDLSSLKYLEYSAKYQVKVNGIIIPVYRSLYNGDQYGVNWPYGPHLTNGIRKMSFASFDLPQTNGDSLSFEITLLDDSNFDNYDIRPWNNTINEIVTSKVLKFSIHKQQKLVITTNDKFEDVLVLSVNPYQRPPHHSKNILYFESGKIYKNVERYRLNDGDTVYIAENAIVQGAFDLDRANHITIYGRGIVYNGNKRHTKDFAVIFADFATNVLLKGITLVNSTGWNFRSFASSNITIKNIKTIGQWLYNTDGIQSGVHELLVEDCFLQTNDDCLTINGFAENTEYRNNIGWNIYNGSHVMLGWNTAQVKNAHIHDDIVIRNGGVDSGPFTMRLKSVQDVFGPNYYKNILVENIIVEEIIDNTVWLSMKVDTLKPSLTMKNVKYRNIEIIKTGTVHGIIQGDTFYNRPIHNVTFENIRINGQCITSPKDGNVTLKHTNNIIFSAVDTSVSTENIPTLVSHAQNATYQWINCENNMPITGETNQSFTPTKSGLYAVEVTQNECSDISSCFDVSVLSVKDYIFKNRLQLYPNPTHDKLVLKLDKSYSNIVIKIRNLLGQTLSTEVYQFKDIIHFRINNQRGIYMIEIYNENGEKAQFKVIKS